MGISLHNLHAVLPTELRILNCDEKDSRECLSPPDRERGGRQYVDGLLKVSDPSIADKAPGKRHISGISNLN